MRISIEKAGKSDCLHEYVMDCWTIDINPPIVHRICKHCGQVEHVQDEPAPARQSYEQVSVRFHGKVVR